MAEISNLFPDPLEMPLTCGECGETRILDQYEVGGCEEGAVLCPACLAEIFVETGKKLTKDDFDNTEFSERPAEFYERPAELKDER